MMSREYALKNDVSSWLVATLGSGRHDSAEKVGRQIIVMVPNQTTASLRAFDVEALGTCFYGRIGFRSTRPYSLNTCVVVTRVRSLEIAMGISCIRSNADCHQESK
jgi:hypothetical protein